MAVLVADNATREITALVSGDRHASRAGMMDLTRAVRSPGSALKPSLYALAFEATLAARRQCGRPPTPASASSISHGDGRVTIRATVRAR